MNISRSYKLWKLGIPVGSKHLVIFEYVESKLLNLEPFVVQGISYSVYYMNKEGKCFFEYKQTPSVDVVKIRFLELWETLVNYCREDDVNREDDVKDFLYDFIADVYKISGDVKEYAYYNIWVGVEELYKNSKLGNLALGHHS